PDATGVGWVYQYALTSPDGSHDLASLRTLQDWFLRYALSSVGGVAEVASVGGFVKQYQVQVDPNRLAAHGLTIGGLAERIRRSNQDVEGRLLELGGREYMVRGRGYLKDLDDLKGIVVATGQRGAPLLLGDVAQVSLGPEIRRGLVEMDGQGEVVGGIVVMRHGENALEVIERVKQKLKEIEPGLPPGVRIVPTYDRSELIRLSIENLQRTLIEEMIVVSLVIVVFLLHFRSALVPILALPIAVALAFIPMYHLRVSSNIMSLGGIALAIGVLVDAAIVMVENAHRRLSEGSLAERADPVGTVVAAAQQVGRALFFSLVIIIVSFVPVFLLEAQEGRMFRPLAFTKTFAMAGASLLAVTLVPVLMTMFIKGKGLKPESQNPVSRFFIRLYEPVLRLALRFPWATLLVNLAVIPATALWLWVSPMGSEFMPALYEGDVLYMPVTNPGLSAAEAGRLLAIQDRVLKEVPEVERVFGKAGRAETSTDPSPFSMMETVIQLKPRGQWRQVERDLSWLPAFLQPPARWLLGAQRRLTYEELIADMDRRVQMPGVQNAWTMPIRARIDMLSTGIRTPVGIKVAGADLKVIEELGGHLEMILRDIPGTRSVYAERAAGGYFVDITARRGELARYGLTVGDVQDVIQTALGGMVITRTVEGRERYTVNLRVLRELRDGPEKLARILVPIPAGGAAAAGPAGMGGGMAGGAAASPGGGAMVPLGQVAEISLASGPAMIRDENGLLTGYVYVDVSGRDIGGYVDEAKSEGSSCCLWSSSSSSCCCTSPCARAPRRPS
ncbi:MAG: efflux RND transporter permease subunit, partial [Desulfarculus sp.]|nr:efflux RND transporter permease subunit [Desulfarculus sp.]